MIKKILFLILFSLIIPTIVFACEGRTVKKSGFLFPWEEKIQEKQ